MENCESRLKKFRHFSTSFRNATRNTTNAGLQFRTWILRLGGTRAHQTPVNRLHPYLGKFHSATPSNGFCSVISKKGDWILDPFLGSGTTLVQANEMGMASIGVDVSEFNCHIAKVKLGHYDLALARKEVLEG